MIVVQATRLNRRNSLFVSKQIVYFSVFLFTMTLQDNEQLNTIVQSAPIGICILDAATFTAELLNDKFLEIAGKPRKAIIGKWYWEPFAEAREYYEDALKSVAKTGEAYYANEVELMLIRHGREERIFVTFVYSPVFTKEGKINKVAVWVLENTRQVTERQKTEAAKGCYTTGARPAKKLFYAGTCRHLYSGRPGTGL